MASAILALAAAAAEGGSKGGLTDFNSTLFVTTIVLFALFAFVLGKFGWKPLLQMVEEREGFVRNAVEGAEKANAEAHSLLEKHKEMLREAGREREEIIKRSLQDAEAIKNDLMARARTESESIVKRAREQVEREKNIAIQELRASVADLAVEAAGRIVKSSMTPDAQKKLVSDFITNLPKA